MICSCSLQGMKKEFIDSLAFMLRQLGLGSSNYIAVMRELHRGLLAVRARKFLVFGSNYASQGLANGSREIRAR